MNSPTSGIPRLARRMLLWTLPRSERDDVLANLEDLFRRRVVRDGRLRAGMWIVGQALTFGARLRLDLWREHRARPSGRVWLAALRRDVAYGFRQFVRAPGFSLAATLTLSLGVGATALIYTVVYAAILRPLPLPDPHQLVWVWSSGEVSLSLRQFTTLQPEVESLAALTAFAGRGYAVVGQDAADEVTGVAVSANHFQVMGRRLQHGRSFEAEDTRPGAERVAIISHTLWQSRFGGAPDVIGRRVDLYLSAAIPMVPGAFSGEPHTVIGVAPPAYRPFGFAVDVFTPLLPNPSTSGFADIGELSVVARLRDDTGPAQLQAELASVVRRLPFFEGMVDQVEVDQVVPLQDALSGHLRPAMFATLAAVGLVLLIACVNVANLLLVRTRDRRDELGIRRALGASRGALVRQLLTESALLAGVATVVGVAMAAWLLPLVVRLLPDGMVDPSLVTLSAGPLGFALGLLFVATVLCGGLSALELSRGSAHTGRSRGEIGRRGHAVNNSLAVAEIGLAVALVYAAGLVATSFYRLTAVETGFTVANVTTVRLAPSEARYRDLETRRALYSRFLDEVRQWQPVVAAGAIHFLPVADGGPSIYFRTDPGSDERMASDYRVVTPGYLDAMRVPVIRGRALDASDVSGGRRVGLVNQTLAARLWPDQEALGQTVYRTNGQLFFEVVGVVADVRQQGLAVAPQPEMYLPLSQSAWASAMTVVLRTSGPAPEIPEALRRLAAEIDPHLPVTRVATMESIVRGSVTQPRFYGLLFSLFGALALLLAAVGVYGVVSYLMGSRRDEIGIRLALGAPRQRIAAREMGRAGVIAGVGITLGVVGSLAGARFLSSLLFGVEPVSAALLFGTAGLIGTVVVAATAIPVRRAARLDPIAALRRE